MSKKQDAVAYKDATKFKNDSLIIELNNSSPQFSVSLAVTHVMCTGVDVRTKHLPKGAAKRLCTHINNHWRYRADKLTALPERDCIHLQEPCQEAKGGHRV